MHLTWHPLALMALLLGGCTSMDGNFGSGSAAAPPTAEQMRQRYEAEKQYEASLLEQDQKQCEKFGFKPDTPQFAKCNQELFSQREARRSADAANQAANQAAITSAVIARGPPQPYPVQVPQQPMPQPYMTPSPITTQCRTDYNGVVTCKTR